MANIFTKKHLTSKQKYVIIHSQEEGEIPMNSIQKDMINPDGTIDTLLITSNDNYQTLDRNKTYKLANNIYKKENKLVTAFKNSILGSEIGVKAQGFSTIAILSTIIAVGMFCIMYLSFKI